MNEREKPMIKLFDTPALVDALKNARRILLCTHINPDGDAIGSTLAVYHVLKKMGKDVTCACADPVPGKLMMLPGADVFVQPDGLEGQTFDLAFALDAADKGRIGAVGNAFDQAPFSVQLDHHPTNPLYADVNAVDGDAAASGCVVFRLLTYM